MTRGAIAVVDCYSTGQFIPERIARRGLACVQVISRPEVREKCLRFADRLPLAESIQHDGDVERTLAALGRFAPRLVLPGQESGVELADLLAERLGLAGNGTAQSRARRDKFQMKEALRARGLRTVDYHRGASLDELVSWARTRDEWPYVIKPMDSAGTEGVHFVNSPEELERWRRELVGKTNHLGGFNATVLLEQRAKGVEFIMNTVSHAGRHVLTDFWQCRKMPSAASSPIYDFLLLGPYPGEEWAEEKKYLFALLDALGIQYGPAHSELMLTPDGMVLIETGARCMGASVSPDMMDACIGQNQIDLTLESYLDPATFLARQAAPYAVKKYCMLKILITYDTGVVKSIPGLDVARRLRSFYGADLPRVGESITRTIDLVTSPGKIVLVHEDPDVIDEDYLTIRKLEEDGFFAV